MLFRYIFELSASMRIATGTELPAATMDENDISQPTEIWTLYMLHGGILSNNTRVRPPKFAKDHQITIPTTKNITAAWSQYNSE